MVVSKFLKIFVAGLLCSVSLGAQDLFLTNAKITDPTSGMIKEGNLLISGGRITGTPESAPDGFSGETIDLQGRWVIPGLNDLHTHSYGNMGPGRAMDFAGTAGVAKRMLFAGVTGFLDLFGNESTLVQVREGLRKTEANGAELFASLSCLTAPEGHCTEYGIPTRVMSTPEEARAEVTDLAAKKPDVVKIVYSPTGRMPSIDKATLGTAIKTAKDLGLKTVIHVNTWNDVRDAVEAGATAVTHVPIDGPVPLELARLMAGQGVYSIPTLAVETDYHHFLHDPAVLDHPLAKALTTATLIGSYRSEEIVGHGPERLDKAREQEKLILDSVGAMAKAGVPILTGTDAGNFGTLQGYSIHRELIKLVAAGLSTWEALAAATTRAGEFLDRPFGVTTGSEAHLLVLDASPVEDIRNTAKIYMVIHRGRVVNRDALIKN